MATKSMFAPPPGPKISRPQPTVPIGQQMPPMQQIPEPVDGIGRYTGIKHFALGDGGAPEVVHVTPTRPRLPGPTGDAPGEVPYAQGGSFIVGPQIAPDPGTPTPQAPAFGDYAPPTFDPTNPSSFGGSESQYYGSAPAPGPPQQITPPGGNGPFSAPAPTQPAAQSYSPTGYQAPPASYNNGYVAPVMPPPMAAPRIGPDPNQQMYNARQAQINAERNVYTATAGVRNGPQQDVYRATAGVNAATAQQNAAQADYLRQQQAEDQRRLGEIQGINAAHLNGPDIQRAAEAENAYAAEDKQDRALGVSAPATVQLPPGMAAVAGVRPKIMTQEAFLSDRAQSADAEATQRLKIAQNVVQLQATNVAAARQAASEAGLTLQEANDMVSQARDAAGLAGLDVSQQQLGEEGKVLYTDPETGQGEYVSQAEADRRKQDYQRQFALGQPGDVLYTDPNTGERSYMSQAEADQRKYDYEQGLTQQRIPQTYAQQQAAGAYATQAQGQGSELAGLSDAQVLNTIPANAGLAAQYQAYEELLRRFLVRHYSQDQAAQAAEALIQQEMASRTRGGGATVTPPAFGGG
jgi:hypothetical protein